MQRSSAAAQLARRAEVLLKFTSSFTGTKVKSNDALRQYSARARSALLLLRYSSLLLVFTGAKAQILTHCEIKKYKYRRTQVYHFFFWCQSTNTDALQAAGARSHARASRQNPQGAVGESRRRAF